MDARTQPAAEASIGELFKQLTDDGANLVRAELNLYRQTAFRRVVRARGAVAAIVAGALIANAALAALLVGFVLALARYIGPVGSGLVVAGAAGAVGYYLITKGIAKISAQSREADQKDRQAVKERVL